MRADGGWLHRSLAGATRQPSVFISTASSGLGLFQYPPIRSDERTSGVSATGADEAAGRAFASVPRARSAAPADTITIGAQRWHRFCGVPCGCHLGPHCSGNLCRARRTDLSPTRRLTSQSNCRGSCSCCNPVPAGVAAVAAISNHVNHRRRKRSDVTGSPYRLPGALTCGNHRKWRLRCTRYCSTRSRWHRVRR